ncbi:MAG: dual specificity protein phosphatase family protein, partial [bacterium]
NVKDVITKLLENTHFINNATEKQIADLDESSSKLELKDEFIKIFPQNFSTLTNNLISGMAKPETPGQIKYLESKNVKLVVTLTKDKLDATLFKNTSVKNIHLPIQSGNAPTEDQIKTFLTEAKQVTSTGGKIVVHCEQGLHRTGTMLALWLITNNNMSAQQAINFVREQRPGSISPGIQEKFLHKFEEQIAEYK